MQYLFGIILFKPNLISPLNHLIFQAGKSSGRKVKVIAVEKNTNAIVTLLTQKDEQWGDQVDVVSGRDKYFSKFFKRGV